MQKKWLADLALPGQINLDRENNFALLYWTDQKKAIPTHSTKDNVPTTITTCDMCNVPGIQLIDCKLLCYRCMLTPESQDSIFIFIFPFLSATQIMQVYISSCC